MLHPPAGQIGNQHRHTAAGWCPSRCPWAAGPGWDVHSNEKPHRCGGCRRVRRAWPGFEIDHSEPQVHAWREPRGPRGPRSRAEVPVGGGRAWPGFEIDDSEPKARVWRSRGRAAAHRHTQPHNNQPHNDTRPRPVSQPRPRRAQSVPLSKAAPPAIRRSCPRGPRPRRGQPRGGRRGRGTGSRTRSRHPRCGRSGSTAGRHRARHTRRA